MSAFLGLPAPLIRETGCRTGFTSARLEDDFLDATTLTEFPMAQGMPRRSAHKAVGKVVRLGEERRSRLADLPPEVYESIRPG